MIEPKKFTIPHDAVWRRPDEAYFDYKEQAKGIAPEDIEWNGKYKTIRELRDLAIFGLSLYAFGGKPFFVQMNTKDPSPDAFVMQESSVEELTANIGPVELTYYGPSRNGKPQQTLLERLTAKGGKFHKLPPRYALVIHIGPDEVVDHQAITNHLNSINAEFQVFSIQQVSNYPDTISRLTVYRPNCGYLDVNIGEVCDELSKSTIFGTVTQVKGRPPLSPPS